MAYNNNKGHEIATQIILFIISSVPIFIIIPFIINFIESIDAPIIFIEPTLINIDITINSLITPILVLTVLTTSVIALPTKTVVLELIYKEFILNAKTCGLSSRKIFISYIFKNSFLNLVDFIVPTLTINMAFSLIIERLFQIPGQSLILLNGFRLGENDLIMFLIFFTTVIIFSLQFLIDLLVQLLNPFSLKKIFLGKQSKLRFIKKIGGRHE
ncbi:ABC transporter permease subunit [Mycoplasmopsis anatis]